MAGAAAVGAIAETGPGIDGIEARLPPPRRFGGSGGGTDERGVRAAELGLCDSLVATGAGADAADGETPGARAESSAVQSAAAL